MLENRDHPCNGGTFEAGSLQAFDLRPFEAMREAKAVTDFIRREPQFEAATCLAYLVFHHESGRRITHGGLVTDLQRCLLRQFDRNTLGLRASLKSDAVLRKVRFYLSDECFTDRHSVWTRH